MNADIFAPHCQDADKACEYLEALRWPDGPICPHCGCIGDHYALKGKSHRPGLWKCRDCRKQFSVTVGTMFERSKIPLNKWLIAVHLMCASKKAISSHQIHRMLGVTYKSAWFMAHCIREAMVSGNTGSGLAAERSKLRAPLRCLPLLLQYVSSTLAGNFHHVGEEHLQRYIAEFDYRWNHRKVTDRQRSDTLLTKIKGKRLVYEGRL